MEQYIQKPLGGAQAGFRANLTPTLRQRTFLKGPFLALVFLGPAPGRRISYDLHRICIGIVWIC